MTLGRWRRLVQGYGILFGLFGITGIGMTHIIFPGLHCYACPLAVTVCPIGLMQNLVVFGTPPFFWLGVIVAYGLVAGRGFCGWFCPFGTLNDLLSFNDILNVFTNILRIDWPEPKDRTSRLDWIY